MVRGLPNEVLQPSKLSLRESEVHMNFIESILNMSPDNGSGVLETVIVLVLFVVPAVIAIVRKNLNRHTCRAE